MAKKKKQSQETNTMATKDEQFQVLTDELNNDPLGRGYAGMTDAQATDSLNVRDRPTEGGPVTHNELWVELIVESEWDDLKTNNAATADAVLQRTVQYPEPWDVNHRFYEEVARAFPGGSQTRVNMNNRAVGQESRGEELGLPRPIKEAWVSQARAA